MPSWISGLRRSFRPLRRIASGATRSYELRRARRVLCDSGDLTSDQLHAVALESPLTDAEKRLVRHVRLRVSPLDLMYRPGWSTSYLTAGLSASRAIQASLVAAGKTTAGGAILDFPCGHGRVLRFLKEMFPDSKILGAEIDAEAVDFCQRVFSVQGYLSNPARSFRSLALPGKFDLIWCGSLITHIDERATGDLLECFCRHLTDGGVCVFTTHGRHVADLLNSKQMAFDLTEEGRKRVVSEYEQKGYGYSDYPFLSPGDSRAGCWGISLCSRSGLVELALRVGPWKPVHFMESGWHALQDVHAFMLGAPKTATH
jgi:SAM-dependent methyltransferase